MKYKRRMIISVFFIILGLVLNVLRFMKYLDSFWSGFGVGFVIVGILQLFRQIKYHSNEEYKEKVDVELNDERNKFIANKAWAWAGYSFVVVAAIMTVVFKLMNQENLMMLCSGSVCFIVLVYYVAYLILKRKY